MRLPEGTCLILALLVPGAAAQAPESTPPDAAAVVAVEREFAADGAARGWAASFRRYHAPGAIVLQPDPIQAEITLAKVEGDGPNTLLWRPAYAGIARSGDFGFTTGPVQIRGQDGVRGHYFTIWRKQPDGRWKWIFDAGCEVNDPNPLPADAEVPTLPIASSGAGSARAAIDAVAAIEDTVAADAAGAVERLLVTMSADARVNRVGEPPAIGQPAAAALMRKDRGLTFTSVLRESSSSGDLVFTLGEARDQVDGKERLRYYARLWQLRPEGWRLVFDELVPRRAPQASA